ncbi:polysaccharide deacetylase family protein [Winogradskyella sp. A3E31]|uniref:polysaccharide deacetylase family protein n=1 Tax=Winogradskyella sp. A3E31 TaxID=3349637 RepID=UPI00398B2E9D
MTKFKFISVFAFIIMVILFGFSLFKEVEPNWLIIVFLLWVLIVALGSFSMSWNFHLKAFNSNPDITLKKIAITFDDGPHFENTPEILNILNSHNAKATFFCIGKHVESYPDILKSIDKNGHSIGNHSYTHSVFIDFNSTKQWISEIKKTDDLIKTITGSQPKLFRPPYGVTTPHLAMALKQTNHKIIGWNKRSYDTLFTNKHFILKRLKKNLKSGDIILLHDTQKHSLYVLEHLLRYLSEHGFLAVTIEELYNEN